MKLGLIQLTSGADIGVNILRAGELIAEAAGKGVSFVATPENTFLMEEPGSPRVYYHTENHPGVIAAREWAKQFGVWILLGSVAVCDHNPNPVEGEKCTNRAVLINPEGAITAGYDKIHLFDVDVPGDRRYAESDRFAAGDAAVVSPLMDGWKLGMSICYDVRFPQLYRTLAQAGANIISVPAAFTAVTGEAHWHTLLKARAIENGCYIIAPAQTGTHPGNRKTFGHSLVVDPWGQVLADGGLEEGVIFAELDLSEVEKTRSKLPGLSHDRSFKLV